LCHVQRNTFKETRSKKRVVPRSSLVSHICSQFARVSFVLPRTRTNTIQMDPNMEKIGICEKCMLLCKQTEKFRKCVFCPREKPSNHAGLKPIIEHTFENLHLANDCRGDKRKGGVITPSNPRGYCISWVLSPKILSPETNRCSSLGGQNKMPINAVVEPFLPFLLHFCPCPRSP